MTEHIDKFNNELQQMIIKLIEIRPKNIKFKAYSQIIKTYNKIKSTKPIESYIIHMLPLKDKIDNHDESVFTKNKFENNKTIDNMAELKNIWSSLDDKNKLVIFEFMINLCNHSLDYLVSIDES